MIKKWFENHPNVKFFNWPTQSNDINPMKFVWEAFKDRLEYVDLPIRYNWYIYNAWEEMKDSPE